jgi:hypothetical protein
MGLELHLREPDRFRGEDLAIVGCLLEGIDGGAMQLLSFFEFTILLSLKGRLRKFYRLAKLRRDCLSHEADLDV